MRRKVGAVLIEFAFAIPVFLVLLYYIHDLPKQKLMQRKMQFVANETAAILHNLAVQKGANGSITKGDLGNAIKLANLSIFPGITQYSAKNATWKGSPLGYFSLTRIYCVVMTGIDTAEVKWCRRIHVWDAAPNYNVNVIGSTAYVYETVIKSWKGTPSQIYHDLRMSQIGDERIIVEHVLASTNIKTNNSALFGFLLYTPKDFSQAFRSITIFTPEGAAFSAKAP